LINKIGIGWGREKNVFFDNKKEGIIYNRIFWKALKGKEGVGKELGGGGGV
jgi:hypothetical protein